MFRTILSYFAAKDVNEGIEKRATFLSQFNHPSATAIEDPRLLPILEDAVNGELQQPHTAHFDQIYVRKCSDSMVRAAGMVTFSGHNGVVSSCGYMAEFISDGNCMLLELRAGFDPVMLKNPPHPDQWDGKSIPYARPPLPAPLAEAKPDWPFRLKLCAIGLIIAVVAYFFRH